MFLSLNHTIQLEWSKCKEILPKFWWFHLFLSFPYSFKGTNVHVPQGWRAIESRTWEEVASDEVRWWMFFSSRWWQLKYLFMFTPKIGEDEPILTKIFQMGWFNHQLVILLLTYLIKFHRKCENRVEVGNVLYYFTMCLWLLYGCF